MDEQTEKFLNKVFVLSAILVLGVLVFFVGEIFIQNKSVSLQNQNQITVSGEGIIYVKPDIAEISLGVTSQASTVADVTKNNTTKMNAVIAAVKKLGVAAKDIQTTNYSLTPVYGNNVIVPMPAPMPLNAGEVVTPDSGSASSGSASGTAIIAPYYPVTKGRVLTGYSLEQDIQVKIRDFTKIGDILSAATSAGSNQVGDLQFTVENQDQYNNQAEAKAIAQAKTNAQALVKASGIQLGKLINVQQGGNFYAPMVYNSAKAMAGATEAAPSPTIQPGQQEIDVTVNLTYQVQ